MSGSQFQQFNEDLNKMLGSTRKSDYRQFPRFPEGPRLHFEKVLH